MNHFIFITFPLWGFILFNVVNDVSLRILKDLFLKDCDYFWICNPPLHQVHIINKYGDYIIIRFDGKDYRSVTDVIISLYRRDFIDVYEMDMLYNLAKIHYIYT